MDFEVSIAIRRSVFGQKVELATITDEEHKYWIIPRKFSVAAKDEMQQLQLSVSKKGGGAASMIAKIRKNHPEITGADFQNADFISKLPPEELAELTMDIPETSMARAPGMRLAFLYGIGKHNMTKDMSESDKVPEWLVDEILQNEDLASEILDIVVGQNPFLLKSQIFGKSMMPQSGSSMEIPSPTIQTNSQMDQIQEPSI